jgi:hypothetical protein
MEVSARLQKEREARVIEGVGAFIRRDFDALERTMHPDVVMRLPGWSWLAGMYRGPAEVCRCIVSLRQVLESRKDRVSFLHEGDQMIMTHEIMLHGPAHDVEMTFSVAVRYDSDERVRTISVEPADLALFDHVLKTAFVASDAVRLN